MRIHKNKKLLEDLESESNEGDENIFMYDPLVACFVYCALTQLEDSKLLLDYECYLQMFPLLKQLLQNVVLRNPSDPPITHNEGLLLLPLSEALFLITN